MVANEPFDEIQANYRLLHPGKIGRISDIHANLNVLRRALELLHEHKVEQILCAGDLVEKGHDGDAVIELLQTIAIPCVMGNHDFDAIGNQAWLRENSDLSHPALRGALLREETLLYLKQLPKALKFVCNDQRLFLGHGAPWSTNEYIFPTRSRHIFERIVREAQADIVILGHTHMPMCIQIGKTFIVNPGAIGGNRDGQTTCAILSLPAFEFQVYSLETALVINLQHLKFS
jgi:putative phosphoesterase